MTTGGATMTGEWWERKARSEALLRARGVPINDWLPVIGEGDDDKRLRTPREVAERAVALYAVSVGAASEEHENAVAFLRERGLWDAASPKERAFLLNPQPEEQEVIDFTWRYQALHVLLWALGHVEDLPFPDETCALPLQEFVLGIPIEDYVGRAALRPVDEILDATDLIYRCHWAVVEALLHGQEPAAGLQPDVVYERHYALNWLTRYGDAEWDDVSTDT